MRYPLAEKYIIGIPFGLAAASSVLLVASQPPVSLSFLAWVALVPLLYGLNGKTPLKGLITGLAAGVLTYLGLIYWVVVATNKYGGINIYLSALILLLFVLYLSLYTAAFGWSLPYLLKRFDVPFYLSAPLVWVLLEYLRGVALTGFPWSFLGHSQHNFLPIIQVTSITGTYFLSGLIVAVNCIVYHLVVSVRGRERGAMSRGFAIYGAVVCVVLALSLVYGYARLGSKAVGGEKMLKVALVQGNISQDVKWGEPYRARTVKTYFGRTGDIGRGFDLIVWPETALPFIFNEEEGLKKLVQTLPATLGAHLLVGTVTRVRGRFHNSAYIMGPDGREEVYHKAHLVPFGEYTPLISYLPFFGKLSVADGEFSPGSTLAPLNTGMGRLGMLICYEGIFPGITRQTVREGAQALINITNDAWYDRTSAPYQHLAFYLFRAVETDRYVLRAANTGISAVIDPRGRIVSKTPIFEDALLAGQFSLRDSKTVYVRYGDYFVWLCLAGLLAACAVRHLRQRAHRQSTGTTAFPK